MMEVIENVLKTVSALFLVRISFPAGERTRAVFLTHKKRFSSRPRLFTTHGRKLNYSTNIFISNVFYVVH